MPETTTVTLTPASTKDAIDRLHAFLDRRAEMMPDNDIIYGVVARDGTRLDILQSDMEILLDVWESRQWAGVRGAVDIALAVHEGLPNGRPDTDADTLRGLADYLDILDDLTRKAFYEAGTEHDVKSEMQADLRRIADKMESGDKA